MISLTNHDFQWGRSEVVIIYPDIIIYPYTVVSLGIQIHSEKPTSLKWNVENFMGVDMCWWILNPNIWGFLVDFDSDIFRLKRDEIWVWIQWKVEWNHPKWENWSSSNNGDSTNNRQNKHILTTICVDWSCSERISGYWFGFLICRCSVPFPSFWRSMNVPRIVTRQGRRA